VPPLSRRLRPRAWAAAALLLLASACRAAGPGTAAGGAPTAQPPPEAFDPDVPQVEAFPAFEKALLEFVR